MSNGFYKVPAPVNEHILEFKPGSTERKELKQMLEQLSNEVWEVPMIINGKEVRTDHVEDIFMPHDLSHKIGYFYEGDASHVHMAIQAALDAKHDWETMPWEDRAAIFLKAADLLAGPYRAKMNAAVMLGQSKNVFQAEIDGVVELVDFYRFNVHFMSEIYHVQPISAHNRWNRTEYRPLEGFIFALSPFNFTSIAGNLSGAPALMGNTIVWKPARTQLYSAKVIMEVLDEAGMPPGVINMINVSGRIAGDIIFNHREFAGLHFTGSAETFQNLYEVIAKNLPKYRSFPRIVGETGGKDFVMVHASAKPVQVSTTLSRGAFEYQGQKCSAASRAYIPESIWPEVKRLLSDDLNSFKMGDVRDFRNFVNAVIDEKAFDSISGYIDQARNSDVAEIILGGKCDKTKGYFIEPTVILTTDPQFITMREEIFGPVLTIYIYKDEDFDETLKIVDNTSPFALTGAILAHDRIAVVKAYEALRHAAGNFYINDKPTGAIVGQQPFGGARASGTNDKAGSAMNLYRWVSPRTIKETFVTPENYRYPFMEEA
jgi:1-pyrroline-5-carboxylate dehydrogenase